MIGYYVFLRLATPTKPKRPEPNNQAAAGTGTVEGGATPENVPPCINTAESKTSSPASEQVSVPVPKATPKVSAPIEYDSTNVNSQITAYYLLKTDIEKQIND